eukprot:SM000129S26145  [mRNA]  locus=s129:247753:249099:- [translate_table: standard]
MAPSRAPLALALVLVLAVAAGAQPAALLRKFKSYKPGKVVTKCDLPWKLYTANGVTTVEPGTTCTWHWMDDLDHCVDGMTHCFQPPEHGYIGSHPLRQTGEVPGSRDLNGFLSPGVSFLGNTYSTFLKPGFYPYYCCMHLLRMTGAILVLPKGKGKSTAPPTKAPPKATAGKQKKSASKSKKVSSGSCVPACNGRCYGTNHCGGTWPFPKTPSNTKVTCTTGCHKYQTDPKLAADCYNSCRGL